MYPIKPSSSPNPYPYQTYQAPPSQFTQPLIYNMGIGGHSRNTTGMAPYNPNTDSSYSIPTYTETPSFSVASPEPQVQYSPSAALYPTSTSYVYTGPSSIVGQPLPPQIEAYDNPMAPPSQQTYLQPPSYNSFAANYGVSPPATSSFATTTTAQDKYPFIYYCITCPNNKTALT